MSNMGETSNTTSTRVKQSATKPTNRKNMGRNARRRRQKVLAIEAAAAQAAVGNSSSSIDETSNGSTTSSILPQDRGYLWPAVKDLCQLSEDDKQALIAQLGYLPGNALKVVARVKDCFPSLKNCGQEEPLVLQLYPLVLRDESDSTKSHRKRRRQEQTSTRNDDDDVDNNPLQTTKTANTDSKKNPLVEPFPTMYWVTHPRFRALISKLELSADESSNGGGVGSIQKFTNRLQSEPDSLESMKRAHAEYGQKRYDLITEEDWKYIRNRKWEAAFAPTRGVAGIRNPSGIKCLHSHAAHYWSGCCQNLVGQWTSYQVQKLLNDAASQSAATTKQTTS